MTALAGLKSPVDDQADLTTLLVGVQTGFRLFFGASRIANRGAIRTIVMRSRVRMPDGRQFIR
jgi:hypothetical protein